MMEDRVCVLSKLAWDELLESIPAKARLLQHRDAFEWPESGGAGPAIILRSPFGYRLLFVKKT